VASHGLLGEVRERLRGLAIADGRAGFGKV
jgi:hypothetical protein